VTDSSCKVYAVRSPDEVRHILALKDTCDLKFLFLRLFITIWVAFANFTLWALRLILFRKWGYKTKDFEHIVAYTVGIVGDNVVMIPALAALRRRYPSAKITLVTNCQVWDQEAAGGVLQSLPYKDRLIILGDDPLQRRGFRFILNERLTGVTCDLFVNLSPFGNRGWIGAVVREMIFARKLGASHAVGFRMSTYSKRGIFNKVQHHFVKNEPRRAREVLKQLGLVPTEGEDLLPYDANARNEVLRKIGENGVSSESFFAVNPGAKFESKCWPADRFAAVSRWIYDQYEASVFVTGTAGERALAQSVVTAAGNRAINLAGETSIQELIELLRLSKGCVTNDTGTMHLAAMVGVPTVAIFTVRHSPFHWLPLGSHVVSLFNPIDCRYCYDDECKIGACLEGISVDDVIHGLKDVLQEMPVSRSVPEEHTVAHIPDAG
jgi:ADP-heptose:LPS heptosyltransferase